MLGRIWLSLAWVLAVVGAILGAMFSWLDLKETGTAIADNDVDTTLIEPSNEPPSSSCWLDRYDLTYVLAVNEQHDNARRISAPECVERLKLQRKQLESRIPLDWTALGASLALWPALVYGVYRWGLWLVRGGKRETAAA